MGTYHYLATHDQGVSAELRVQSISVNDLYTPHICNIPMIQSCDLNWIATTWLDLLYHHLQCLLNHKWPHRSSLNDWMVWSWIARSWNCDVWWQTIVCRDRSWLWQDLLYQISEMTLNLSGLTNHWSRLEFPLPAWVGLIYCIKGSQSVHMVWTPQEKFHPLEGHIQLTTEHEEYPNQLDPTNRI